MQPFQSYQRILIIGSPGAGKSTLARQLARHTGLPLIHLDQVFWRPHWTLSTTAEFDAQLELILNEPKWIIDGNYGRTLDHRLRYADAVIYLDYPTEVCLESVMKRIAEYQGQTRPDMPEFCDERLDDEFIDYVRQFNRDKRPAIIETLAQKKLPTWIFTSRQQLQEWLSLSKIEVQPV